MEGLDWGGYGDLFHLGCLCTLVLTRVGGGVIMYEGFIFSLMVIFSSFDSRFGMSIVVFLWCMHIIRTASVSMHGSLFSSGGMIGSVYIMVSGGKCMMTCVSSGMVRIVIVS
jgi:hypothetical protein